MPININTNAQSLFAQNAVNKSTLGLQRSIEKLSTGFRINRAADDAAGLSMSETLTAQIRGLAKAEQNLGDAISMVQTAEGALGSIQDNLQRIRELVVQASNGSNGQAEENAIQREINALVTSIEDIGDNTSFNNINLLDGSANSITFQTGANNGSTTAIDFDRMVVDIDATTANSMGENSAYALSALKITRNDAASVGGEAAAGTGNTALSAAPLSELDDMITNVSRMRSELGAFQNSFESKGEYLAIARSNALSAKAHIKDADIAKESSNLVRNQILQQSATAILSQANAAPQVALSLLP